MIFGSLGFLVVSAFLLAFGIGKSSVPMLVLAFIGSAVAGLLLIAAYRVHRATQAGERAPASPFAPGLGRAANGVQPIILMPVNPDGTPYRNGGSLGLNGEAEPIVGYAGMAATQIAALVRSGALTDDQLRAIRAYESAHHARKSVLTAIDAQPAQA